MLFHHDDNFWKIPDTLRLYSSLLMMVYAYARR
jgi:hypothetical protein